MLPDPALAGPAYRGVRTRIGELIDASGPDVADVTVPATPDWTVRQVVAHLVGGAEDVLAQNLDGVASDAWTAAQVDRHADADLAALLARWDEVGPQVEEVTPLFPKPAAAQFVFDATTHEHDLRGALGAPGARDSDGVLTGVAFLAGGLVRGGAADGLPALRVEADGTTVAGDEDAAVVLSASAFELLRALGGRRSMSQVRALDWSGDAEPYLARIGAGELLRPPADDLVE